MTALGIATSQRTHLSRSASDVDRVIRVSTAIVVLAVAGIAAYVSYWHAYAVVREYGETGVTASLEPVTIDGLVYASSMVVLYAARHQLPVPRLARWLLALGIVATLAANMAQGWSHGPGGMVVAAWPAVSLVGSYELLVWIIRKAASEGPGDRVPVADQYGPQAGRPDHEARINASAVAAYHRSIESGSPLSERKLAGMFGKKSRRWARNRIAEARKSGPVPA